MTDPIADMLTRIRNALTAKHDTVTVPASKVKVAIEYGTNLKLKYQQYHSRVRLDGSSSRYLRFEKDETRAGYLPAGSIGYEFYAMVDGDWMYYPAEPVECSPNDFITFHVELDLGTGSLKVVTVRVDGSPEELYPGMNVSAKIIVEEVGNVLALPVEAVERGNTVLVATPECLDEKGNVVDITAAQERQVTLGRNDDNYIEIVDGLEEGEVILAPSPQGSNMMEAMMGMG